jgi:hypothetical protein
MVSRLFILVTLLVALTPSSALAADAQGPAHYAKVIDFEDELVEGMNKKPLDSLSQVSERDRKRHRPHLYRKRAGFRTETAETVRTSRYLP